MTSESRHLRVLLVEDDPMIRLSTSNILGDLGHFVVEAADGSEALALLDKQAFDVLVTDISLPKMPGDELAALAVSRQPGLRMVFASGYTVPAGFGRAGHMAKAVFLSKPYDERELAEALASAVASR